MIKKCIYCKKEFSVSLYRSDTAKYCSRKCHYDEIQTRVKIKCLECGKEFKVIHCREDSAKYCSYECSYKNIQNSKKGIPRTDKVKRTISDIIKKQYKNGRENWNKGTVGLLKGRTDEKSNFWKGGTSNLWQQITNSVKYKKWRIAVFTRDNFKCVWCDSQERIEGHHIKAKSQIVNKFLVKNRYETIDEKFDAIMKNCEELWDIDNGITLCRCCHKQTDNYAGKKPHSE